MAPDDADIAQAINEQFQTEALADHFRRGIRNAGRDSVAECLTCGEDIPMPRRRAQPGCTRCVDCQEQHENLTHWR